MREVLEERLATHLRALGETVDDEITPPVDLEHQVLRRRRRARATRRGSTLSVAAAVLAVAATVAVVHGTTGRGSLRIATSPTTAVPVRDALQPGTVMLSARGRFVISLDAKGHTNATMVKAQHGDIVYARATDDHRALWYLSLKKGLNACGDVVRADIEGRTSTIVTHAVAFDVSADGSRLALYGAGDLAHDRCSPVRSGSAGRIVVRDLTSSTSASVGIRNVTSLRWSPDGSYIVAVSCARSCDGFERIDVPAELGAPLAVEPARETGSAHAINSASVVFGPGGLYALETTTPLRDGSVSAKPVDHVNRVDPRTLFATVPPVFSGGTAWRISQVVPTSVGLYVVAAPAKSAGANAPPTGDRGLYRLDGGKLVFVRGLVDPGTLTPVAPIVDSG
jgi:hypothetical protein